MKYPNRLKVYLFGLACAVVYSQSATHCLHWNVAGPAANGLTGDMFGKLPVCPSRSRPLDLVRVLGYESGSVFNEYYVGADGGKV